MKSIKLHFLLIIVSLFLFACAPAHIPLKANFFQQQNQRIGIVVETHPEPHFEKVGMQGLLEYALNDAFAGSMKNFLQTVEPLAFDSILTQFQNELDKRGIKNTVKLTSHLNLSEFPLMAQTKKDKEFFEVDLSSIAAKENIDILILLRIQKWGAVREYFSLIPISGIDGYCETKGTMVDLKTNKILWQYATPYMKTRIPTVGDWNEPPEYPNLKTAIKKSIELGRDTLMSEFFKS